MDAPEDALQQFISAKSQWNPAQPGPTAAQPNRHAAYALASYHLMCGTPTASQSCTSVCIVCVLARLQIHSDGSESAHHGEAVAWWQLRRAVGLRHSGTAAFWKWCRSGRQRHIASVTGARCSSRSSPSLHDAPESHRVVYNRQAMHAAAPGHTRIGGACI